MLPYGCVATEKIIRNPSKLVYPRRSVKTTSKILTDSSVSSPAMGLLQHDQDSNVPPPAVGLLQHDQDSSVSPPVVGLLQHDQDSSVPPPAVGLLQHDQDSRDKTGDTMAPILPHSDTEDTTMEFGQNHEQQGDQMLPYRGVTTGSTVRISNMPVHPGRSVKTTNKVPTGISKSIVTDEDTDTDPPPST